MSKNKKKPEEFIRNYASEGGKKTPIGPCPRFGLSRKSKISENLFKSPLLSPMTPINLQTTPEVNKELENKTPGRISNRKKVKKNLQDNFDEGEGVKNKTDQVTEDIDEKPSVDVATSIIDNVHNVSEKVECKNVDSIIPKPIKGRKPQIINKKSLEISSSRASDVEIDQSVTKPAKTTSIKINTDNNQQKAKNTTSVIQLPENKVVDSVQTDNIENELQTIRPKRSRQTRKMKIIDDSSDEDIPISKISKKSNNMKNKNLDNNLNREETKTQLVSNVIEDKSPPPPLLSPQIELKSNSRIKITKQIKPRKLNQQTIEVCPINIDNPLEKTKENKKSISISETPMSCSSINSEDSIPLAVLSKQSLKTKNTENIKDEIIKERNLNNQENKVNRNKKVPKEKSNKKDTVNPIKQETTMVAIKQSIKKPIHNINKLTSPLLDHTYIHKINLTNTHEEKSTKIRKSFSLKRSSDSFSKQKSDSDNEFGELQSTFLKKPKHILSSSSDNSLHNEKLNRQVSGLSEIKNLALSNKLSRHDSNLSNISSNNLSDELLRNEIASLETMIKQKQNRLDTIKQAAIYRNKHKVSEVNQVTKLWEEGCKKALITIHQKLTEHGHQISVDVLMDKFKVPTDTFKFDSFNYCFV